MNFRFLIFFSVFVLLFVYTGWRAGIMFPNRRYLLYFFSFALFVLIAGYLFYYRFDATLVNSPWFRALAWTSAVSMGFWATFLLFSIPVDLLQVLSRLFPDLPVDETRRGMLAGWIPYGVIGLSSGIGAIGLFEASRGPKIVEVTVPIANLPPGLENFRIAQISDLHIGPTIQTDYVNRIVARVLETKPDLIAITGDLVDGTPEYLNVHLQPLKELKAPLGTFYVTGNHEYYWGVEQWLRKTEELGFKALLNENVSITHKNAKILVAGVTDLSSEQFLSSHKSDPKKAAHSSEEHDFKLLLAHRPDSCFEAEPEGFHLQLSGHTHAGQFFPWNLIVKMAHKYYKGLNLHGKMWVYVNAGTGYWGPPHRFAVPAEVTLLKLTRKT